MSRRTLAPPHRSSTPARLLGLAVVLCTLGIALAAGAAYTVGTRPGRIQGQKAAILVNGQGMTLYYNKKDTPTAATCTGMCSGAWPALTLASGKPTGPASISSALTVVNDGNGRQVEYRGHPLYTYSGDSQPGQTSGEGYAGRWFVATATLKPNHAGGGAQ